MIEVISNLKLEITGTHRVRLKVMRECKACLAMACAGEASLALQANFQTPPDSCASLLIAPVLTALLDAPVMQGGNLLGQQADQEGEQGRHEKEKAHIGKAGLSVIIISIKPDARTK